MVTNVVVGAGRQPAVAATFSLCTGSRAHRTPPTQTAPTPIQTNYQHHACSLLTSHRFWAARCRCVGQNILVPFSSNNCTASAQPQMQSALLRHPAFCIVELVICTHNSMQTIAGLSSGPRQVPALLRVTRIFVLTLPGGGLLQRCTAGDYENWSPPTPNTCLLGTNYTITRRKAGSLCYNDRDFQILNSSTPCACSTADVECEYGFMRTDDGAGTTCVPIPGFNVKQCAVSISARTLQHCRCYSRSAEPRTPSDMPACPMGCACVDNVGMRLQYHQQHQKDGVCHSWYALDAGGRCKAVPVVLNGVQTSL